MPINPTLLTSGGTQSQISVLNYGEIIPATITLTIAAAATTGDTSLSISSDVDTTLYAGLVFKMGTAPNEHWVTVAPNANNTVFSYAVTSTASPVNVEPITKDIALNDTASTYAAQPLIGLEAANMELTAEENSVVLLANGGWNVRDYSTGTFSFTGTLYKPTTLALQTAANSVVDALRTKKNVYFERVLPDGTYHAGLCMVASASDTTQGAQYVSQSVTFSGSGEPIQVRLNAA